MESIAREKGFEEAAPTSSLQHAGECTRISQGLMLDELPGAVFVAITLIWIVTSFANLTW